MGSLVSVHFVRPEKVEMFSGCNSHPATGSLEPVRQRRIGAAEEVTKPSKPSRQMRRIEIKAAGTDTDTLIEKRRFRFLTPYPAPEPRRLVCPGKGSANWDGWSEAEGPDRECVRRPDLEGPRARRTRPGRRKQDEYRRGRMRPTRWCSESEARPDRQSPSIGECRRPTVRPMPVTIEGSNGSPSPRLPDGDGFIVATYSDQPTVRGEGKTADSPDRDGRYGPIAVEIDQVHRPGGACGSGSQDSPTGKKKEPKNDYCIDVRHIGSLSYLPPNRLIFRLDQYQLGFRQQGLAWYCTTLALTIVTRASSRP